MYHVHVQVCGYRISKISCNWMVNTFRRHISFHNLIFCFLFQYPHTCRNIILEKWTEVQNIHHKVVSHCQLCTVSACSNAHSKHTCMYKFNHSSMSVYGIKNALEYIISNNNLLMDKVEQNTQFCQWLADQ